jgi:hypothetical protein
VVETLLVGVEAGEEAGVDDVGEDDVLDAGGAEAFGGVSFALPEPLTSHHNDPARTATTTRSTSRRVQ